MQKIGIIDLGSNTTRLIVMAYELERCFRLVDEVSEVVRLAEGVGATGRLQPKPIRRAVVALSMFETLCRRTGVDQVIAVGTSAIREAANQHEFWDALRAETTLDLRIISAQEEAFYGFVGTANALGLRNGFTFDTGGGSTQVVAVRNGQPTETYSVQAGVVRFTERYVTSDPISKRDLRNLRQAAQESFAGLTWLQAHPNYRLAGMGGTIRTLARIDQKQRQYPLDRVHGYQLSREALSNIIEVLSRSNRREREQIPGLKTDRTDVTLAGAIIIEQLMMCGRFESLTVSGQGVREGLFYAHFLQGIEPPLLNNPRTFSIKNLARLSNYEEAHCDKVGSLSQSLFDQLAPLHSYGAWERELLGYAAIIHDIGVAVGYYDHHKHSEYLVYNGTLLGFTHREIAILGALVRNHRKGQADLSPYAQIFAADDSQRIARLSSLLRIAEYLERSKSQVVRAVRVELGESIRIVVEADGDASVGIWDANRRTGLFRKAFERDVEIVQG
ncbi:Ppx/GppA family phosphatase [Candidatus Chloroploca sp. M-50]|uniref:Ppx/GppA family phosphatase n=1 Tax=Candidatus Chloroploca mongolica TaxID=2528176 RepID=A0ABS4DEA9_9CHLR|nr:Ppx/GppA phosphatase family protein [Candidatus Chloroploca mongolica]MBP1467772.1 Ppx/GppA family phosphatase [Candidatus Chloroploca mongolica]